MGDRQTVLVTVSVLIQAEPDEVAKFNDSEFCEVDRVANRIVAAIDRELGVAGAPHSDLGWQSMTVTVLDEATMNCGQCAVCRTWVSDRDKPEPVLGLAIGAVVDGALFCDEHLPASHPRAF